MSTSTDVRQRRGVATGSSGKDECDPSASPDHAHSHEPEQSHDHSHTHSHGLFGHSHANDGPSDQAQTVAKAFESGATDPGSRITLIGLFSNIGLTGAKGFAGYYMNSAALLADAGHSLSDLVGDFVTLFCWRLSRRPPSALYPYGFAKFETIGTAAISLLLLGGAIGIGIHAMHLLLQALAEPVAALPPDSLLASAYQNVTHLASSLPLGHSHGAGGHAHGHGHEHGGGLLDANAAWFAGGSIIAKEWLYRITKKVADQENSPVLLANALHHRSDAYSSAVALVAIGGSVWFPHVPLDPIGGFLVSMLILQQGISILSGTVKELTDASVPPATTALLSKALTPLLSSSSSSSSHDSTTGDDVPSIRAITDLRARRAGARTFVELTAQVDGRLHVGQTAALERRIVEVLRKARGEVDVLVRFVPDEKR